MTLFLIILSPFLSFSFTEPDILRCDSKLSFSISSKNGSKDLNKGIHSIPLNQVSVLKIKSRNGKIANLYPQGGLDSLIFQKKSYRVESDERRFWRLINNQNFVQINCELIYE
jgi:hypothetical protein